jgi:hypothetical protein
VDHDAVLIVLSNAQLSPGRWMRHVVSADLERILLRDAPRYAPPPARLATPDETRALVGTYAVGDDRLHVISDGTQLWVAAAGQSLAERLYAGDIGEHALGVANRKLEVLLGGLQRGVSDAYRTALTEEGLPHLESYMAEWERLTRALGPFERFEALGSLPLRDVVEATAQLRFRDGWVTMTYLWDQGGRGRLRGTNSTIGRRFPIAVPAAIASADTIVLHDPWRETTLRLAIEAGGLRFADGARAIRVGAVAWRP